MTTNIMTTNKCHICGLIYDNDSHSTHSNTHMTPILPNLYLGSKTNAHSLNELKYFQIKTVFNVAYEIQKPLTNELKYIRCYWDDHHDFDILVDLDEIVDQIHGDVSKNNAVLIHCAHGISRSPTVIIGYLIKYLNMSFNDARKHVKLLRHNVNPNKGFIEKLKMYDMIQNNDENNCMI